MLFVVHQGIVPVEQGQSRVDDHGRCYRHESYIRVTRLDSTRSFLCVNVRWILVVVVPQFMHTFCHCLVGYHLLPRLKGDHHGDHSRLDTVVFKTK